MEVKEIEDFSYFADGAAVKFCDPEFGDQLVCRCFASLVLSETEVAKIVAKALNAPVATTIEGGEE